MSYVKPMLYLVVHGLEENGEQKFASPLSAEGRAQAQYLSSLLDTLAVQSIFTAPNKRSLDTVQPYIRVRTASNKFLRVEVHYNLTNATLTPELRSQSMTLEHIQQYGLNRQSLYGVIPEIESEAEHQRRVIEWYTNHLLPEYRDCPYPTAIVADKHTIATLAHYMMLLKGTGIDKETADSVVAALSPGAVLEFSFDNMALVLKRRVI